MIVLSVATVSMCVIVLSLASNPITLTEALRLLTMPAREPGALPGLLYPRESETREVKSLDGLWDFAIAPSEDPKLGHRQKWFEKELFKSVDVIKMPVPSSYNDVTTSAKLRDHVGVVWYERTFFVPAFWRDQRVFVRFGSVNYLAQVWLNGDPTTIHEMGHLPFEAEITEKLKFGELNRITVAVDNSLSDSTVPQGQEYNGTADKGAVLLQSYSFDFFNYAGIHRPVLLYTKPQVSVDDISIHTSILNGTGHIAFTIQVAGSSDEMITCSVSMVDGEGMSVARERNFSGIITVPNAKLWWPQGMSDHPGYLYTLEVHLSTPTNILDVYRLPVGVRTVAWTNQSLLLNGEPLYLRGFGRHEDSVLRGRGLDLVTLTRDYELLAWVGANAYRTSHYPYSDEMMDEADRRGFLVVDECPSVDTDGFKPELLRRHKDSISQLVRRDKNRPSVVMWSISNEPRSQKPEADSYFKEVAAHTRSLDPSRPVTAALARGAAEDKAGQHLDVISFNRYNSWYHNTGRLDMITKNVIAEAKLWNFKYNKPVLMSEYGADTMPGLHEFPEYVWSEEYQTALLSKHFMAFDDLRGEQWFIGEFIWNFADFRTAQSYTRVGGNKKGIFTRTREPKMAAYHVRRRYHALGEELNGQIPPPDLNYYFYDH